ncbi:deleted in malignant brain tumors 1 protein-like isoform X2 [Acropora millepora]|uniref:deleted in malignant brain tumors 1 protein-like isoform X2 n=1 Tax=Acropora millepora TaxID=45264 RepID=UPI001CF20E48|nr:deleted in malignant brain tumors 1 protein-like isoform X2 [Acropora millepora]
MASFWVLSVALLSLTQSVESTPCGSILNGSTSGSLSSPNFPALFPSGQTQGCSWTIRVPSGRIKLIFHNFTLEEQGNSNCVGAQGARLRITNVASDDNQANFVLCGPMLPFPVYSTGNFMSLTLVSATNDVPGFNASYETITDEMLCPSAAVLTDMSGEITSPFYPRNYPSAQNCLWKIEANKGKRLELEVIDMEIERCGQSGACTCDYLEIQNAYNSDDGAASAKTCVDVSFTPVTYYSTNNTINVQFSSDLPAGRRHKGFKAIYTVLSNTPPECPSFPISLSGNGTMSSPNYPGSNYPSSRTCEWIIEAMAGRRVMVNITDFAMGTCNGCGSTTTCSRVEFYDGPSKDSPLLERFCTGSQREAIISSGVQLFVRFQSGFSPDRGFQADYAEILSSMAETIATTATTIATTTTTIATTATTVATTETTGAAVLSITSLLVVLPSVALTML